MRVPPVSDRIKEAPAQALRGVFAGIGQLLLITDKLRNKTPTDQHVPSARVPEPAESVAEAGGVTVVQEQAAAASAAGVAEAAGAGATVEAEVTEVPRARKPAERKSAERKPAQPKAAQEKAATAPTAAEQKATQEKAAATKAAGQKAAEQKAAPRPSTQRTPKTPAEKATETRDFDRTGNVRLLPDTGGAAKAARARADAAIPAAQAASEPPPAVGEPAAAAGAGEARSTVAAGAGEGTGTTVEAGASEAPLPNYDELSLASLRARLRNLDTGQVRELAEYEKAHAGRADVIAMFERRIAKLEIGD